MTPAELERTARAAHERLMRAYAASARHHERWVEWRLEDERLMAEIVAAAKASNRTALALAEGTGQGDSNLAQALRMRLSEAA